MPLKHRYLKSASPMTWLGCWYALLIAVVASGSAASDTTGNQGIDLKLTSPLHTLPVAVVAGFTDDIFSNGFEPVQNLLSVSVSNQGGAIGNVISTPAGIDCEPDCEALFDREMMVDLLPTSVSDSVFNGWSGDCEGTGVCSVSMDQARLVEASFSENNQVSDGFPPPPVFCGATPAGRRIPFDIFRDFQLNPPNGVGKINYEQTWGLWPGGDSSTIYIPIFQYVAVPFTADEVPGKIWRLDWVGGPSNGSGTQVSVSLCPGDFQGVGYSDAFCAINSGAEGSTLLAIIGEDNLACDLLRGEVYYLNIRHSDANGQNSCFEASNRCGFRGAPSTLN